MAYAVLRLQPNTGEATLRPRHSHAAHGLRLAVPDTENPARLREIVAAGALAQLALHADGEHMRWFGAEPRHAQGTEAQGRVPGPLALAAR